MATESDKEVAEVKIDVKEEELDIKDEAVNDDKPVAVKDEVKEAVPETGAEVKEVKDDVPEAEDKDGVPEAEVKDVKEDVSEAEVKEDKDDVDVPEAEVKEDVKDDDDVPMEVDEVPVVQKKEVDDLNESAEVTADESTPARVKKIDELAITDEDKLEGGLKVFRNALNQFAANQDQDVTVYHVMEKCKSISCYVGIDEAGRGPVLGPMVYSIFACVSDEDSIKAKKGKGQSLAKIEESPPILLDTYEKVSKLNDSKQLTEKVREDIFKKFSDLDYIAFGIKIISPSQIANKSYRRQKYSLNEISHIAATELIQGLADRGVKIQRVYVDTVGPMDKYQARLESSFPDLRFKVDKKADSKYKPVSAASVCAKVTRDIAVKEWKFIDNENVQIERVGCGSGYPADPVTKRFLRKNIDPIFGFPNIVRNSWSTASDLLEKCAVKIKWESDESEAPAPKISKYFTKKASANDENDQNVPEISRRKSQFFSYRELTQTASIF